MHPFLSSRAAAVGRGSAAGDHVLTQPRRASQSKSLEEGAKKAPRYEDFPPVAEGEEVRQKNDGEAKPPLERLRILRPVVPWGCQSGNQLAARRYRAPVPPAHRSLALPCS